MHITKKIEAQISLEEVHELIVSHVCSVTGVERLNVNRFEVTETVLTGASPHRVVFNVTFAENSE